MALRRWTCTECGHNFQEGDWFCYPGQPHVVEAKTYYMDDAPHDKRDCKNSRLVMENIIRETTYIDNNGMQRTIPGRAVTFVRGQYTTSDPHEQKGLDERKTVSRQRWEEVYFSDHEKLEIEKRTIAAERQRLVDERNSLLAQVKKLKTAKGELQAEVATK